MWAAGSVVLGLVMVATVDWRVTAVVGVAGAVWWFVLRRRDPP